MVNKSTNEYVVIQLALIKLFTLSVSDNDKHMTSKLSKINNGLLELVRLESLV